MALVVVVDIEKVAVAKTQKEAELVAETFCAEKVALVVKKL